MSKFFNLLNDFLESDLFQGYWVLFVVLFIIIVLLVTYIVNLYYIKIYIPKETIACEKIRGHAEEKDKKIQELETENQKLKEELKDLKIEYHIKGFIEKQDNASNTEKDGLRKFIKKNNP